MDSGEANPLTVAVSDPVQGAARPVPPEAILESRKVHRRTPFGIVGLHLIQACGRWRVLIA
jgi:hypothetical protein